jgi:ubiquinone/menaquinone biosynthesis C-methylase UbiE
MKNNTDITIETYNTIALDYERNGINLSAETELNIFTQLLKPKARILDLGCGFGRELLAFTQHGFDTYGIDASKELLKLAKKRAPKASIQLADLRDKLPFENDYFDGIWARNSLHHLNSVDIKKTLQEIKRVLNSNGILYAEFKEGKGEAMTKEELAEGKERFYNLLSQNEVVKIIENSGFKIFKSYIYNWNERYNKKRKYSNFIVTFSRKQKEIEFFEEPNPHVNLSNSTIIYFMKDKMSSFVSNLDSEQKLTIATLGLWENPIYSTNFPFSRAFLIAGARSVSEDTRIILSAVFS